jgi:polygalacturonase
MKKIFFSALMMGAALMVSAQSKYDKYYVDLPIEIEHVQEVKFPATSVNIAQYGAVPDGKTDCTAAFAAAIKALSEQGGGHVIVPRGVWKTGPIELKSNIDLHLTKGATILGSENKELYVQKDDPRDGSKKCHQLIRASKC